jgi:5'-phosphate synthase pdxT subunit
VSQLIGILSLQGDFPKHEEAFGRLEVRTRQVRTEADLEGLGGLVIPGGESTTLSRLLIPASAGMTSKSAGMTSNWAGMTSKGDAFAGNLAERLRDFAGKHPVWGTCAGMILLCKEARDPRVTTLGLLDAEVVRIGYGRQVHSFETDLDIPCLNESTQPFRGVFIRAPRVVKVGEGVEVLARLNGPRFRGDDTSFGGDKSSFRGDPVMLRQGHILATSFHPELTDDLRIQRYFLSFF